MAAIINNYKKILRLAHIHHMEVYLNENPSEHLLAFVLHLETDELRVDSMFSGWLIGQMGENGNTPMFIQ